jgi:large conductance mechanosensitive channel
MKNLLKELKEFIMRGNVMDMAIGIIIGLAFGKIVTSLVNDIIMPPIGFLLGNLDFSNLFVNLTGGTFDSLQAAEAAGAALIKYGVFINTIIDFIIVAVVVFFIIKLVNNIQRKAKKSEAEAAPTTKECQYCLSAIPIKATRCPNCTSQLT